MVVIAAEKCIGCGLCVGDCPVGNLAVEGGRAVVRGRCMECGHCFAICPQNAVTLDDLPLDGVEEIDGRTPFVTADAFLRHVKARRSIRRFTDEPVRRETLAHILEAGRFTPTARNAQDVRFIVVQDDLDAVRRDTWAGLETLAARLEADGGQPVLAASLRRLQARRAGGDPLFFNAPALLLVVADTPLDGGMAAANIEMMATAEGLGVLYSGFIQRALGANVPACRALGFEPGQLCACMLLGVPAVAYRRTAPRKPAQITWR